MSIPWLNAWGGSDSIGHRELADKTILSPPPKSWKPAITVNQVSAEGLVELYSKSFENSRYCTNFPENPCIREILEIQKFQNFENFTNYVKLKNSDFSIFWKIGNSSVNFEI